MFFRRRKAPDPRGEAWASLAQRLELEPLPEAAAEALQAELGADTGRLTALHALRREGLPELLLFEHVRTRRGLRGREEVRPRVLLRAEDPISDISWRAFPRSHPLLASLQASRSGGELVGTGDPEFDERVGVVGRHPGPLSGRLTSQVRASLLGLLASDDLPDANVTCGGHLLAWRGHGEIEPPLDVLETVIGRLLVLWVSLGPYDGWFGRD